MRLDDSGAIAGSYPIWGAPLRYPCWATKYYLDLLFLVLQARRLRPAAT